MKKNRKMSTCNWLDLETLGSRLIMLINLPRHRYKVPISLPRTDTLHLKSTLCKADEFSVWMDTFFMKHAISARWLAKDQHIQIVSVVICLVILGTRTNVVCLLIEWIFYRSPPPPSNSLLSLEWLAYFEHVAQYLFKDMSFWCHFLNLLFSTYHSNMGIHSIVVFDLGMSTLPLAFTWVVWFYEFGT